MTPPPFALLFLLALPLTHLLHLPPPPSPPPIGSLDGITAPTALFVFGDSYGDTGNHNIDDPTLYQPWRIPYGQTWPGKPAGRFSDGKILTDNIASFLRISPPLPYRERKAHPCRFPSGMNFAFGRSGVFPTFGPQFPTLARQIRRFERIKRSCPGTEKLIKSSLVLLVIAGNDYTAYLQKNNGTEGIVSFIPKVVDGIASSVRKLYNLDFQLFALANLAPTGCFERFTAGNNFTKCNETINALSEYHNALLSTQIAEISKLPGVQIIFLNQQESFLATIKKFGNSLEPCCRGFGSSNCGDVDAEGKPLYRVCSNPPDAFFWDGVHPTQAGWKAVSETYRHLLNFHQGQLTDVRQKYYSSS